MIHKFETASSLGEAQDMLRSPNFSLSENVVLEGRFRESEVEALEQAPLTDNSTAEIIRYEPDRVAIKAYAEHASILVLTDTWYPGWEVRVDGVPTAIHQADGLVRAVYLTRGEHMVEFMYSPESFRIGLTTTVISAVVLLSLLVISRFKMRHRSRSVRKIEQSNGNGFGSLAA
jgi:uncharacterized membrane protein YfhO